MPHEALVSIFLVVLGIVGGIYATVLGGGFFFYTPFFQVLFPSISLGSLIGNIRFGAVFRGIGTTFVTHRLIAYRKTFLVMGMAFVGTIVGALIVADLSQKWLLPGIVLAIVVSEFAPAISKLITRHTFGLFSFLTGFYMAVMGAGTGILLVALFRIKDPADTEIAVVKVQARFAEFLLSITAVLVYFFTGSLDPRIWIPWSVGMFVGGILGGWALKRVSGWSSKNQKLILRISFTLAFGVALWVFFK